MRKLVVTTFVTLDGVMQAPGGPEEDTAGGFEHGGWSFGYWDEAMGQWMGETMGKPFALLLGRKTYEIFAAYWPNAGDQPGSAELNAATKYVASKTLDSVDWANSVLLEGDAAESVARLKEDDGPEVQVHGSSDLIQTLLANQLVDEFRVWVFPVVLGSGKRLFGDGTNPAGLELVDSKTSTSGVLLATYKPAGEPKYGSFAPEKLSRQVARSRNAGATNPTLRIRDWIVTAYHAGSAGSGSGRSDVLAWTDRHASGLRLSTRLTAPFGRYGYSANGQLVDHGAGHGRKQRRRSQAAAQAR